MKGALDRRRLARVLDFVAENLGQELGIVELAAIAHLCSGHFSEAFCRSVGMSPHRYILSRPVAVAKRLLADGEMSSPRSLRRWVFRVKATLVECFGPSPARRQNATAFLLSPLHLAGPCTGACRAVAFSRPFLSVTYAQPSPFFWTRSSAAYLRSRALWIIYCRVGAPT